MRKESGSVYLNLSAFSCVNNIVAAELSFVPYATGKCLPINNVLICAIV